MEYYLHFSLTRADILVKQRKPTVALQTLEQAMLKYETAETGSEEVIYVYTGTYIHVYIHDSYTSGIDIDIYVQILANMITPMPIRTCA